MRNQLKIKSSIIAILIVLLLFSLVTNTYLYTKDKKNINIKIQNIQTNINLNRGNNIYLNVKKYPFNAKGNKFHDDSASIQSSINYVAKKGGGTIYLPHGTYKVTKTIYIPDNVTIIGEGQGEKSTVIKYIGEGFAIKSTRGHTRINVENLRIDLNTKNSGIQLGDLGKKLSNNMFPAHEEIRNVTIAGIGKGQVGIKLSNVSHANLINVSTGYGNTIGGYGLLIYADKLNSGVIHAENSTFGRVNASDVGLEINGTVDLDTFSFEGCYFGGKFPIRLGINSVIRNINFFGSHIEGRNKYNTVNLVEIYNVAALTFIGTSLIGFKQSNSKGFVFRGNAQRVNIFGVEANGIMGAVYSNEGRTVKNKKFLQKAVLTNGSTALQYWGF